MRIIIDLDQEACGEVMVLLGVHTESDAINAALRDVLRRGRTDQAFEAAAGIPVVEDPEAHYRRHGMAID